MSIVTIRKLDPKVKARIEKLAQINGRSMAGEIRALLTQAVGLGPSDAEDLKNRVRFDKMEKTNAVRMLGEMIRRSQDGS